MIFHKSQMAYIPSPITFIFVDRRFNRKQKNISVILQKQTNHRAYQIP